MRVKDNKDGTYDVACVPKEPGPHELALDYDGVPLAGSPFKFDAVEGGADKVKAYGKGKASHPYPTPLSKLSYSVNFSFFLVEENRVPFDKKSSNL